MNGIESKKKTTSENLNPENSSDLDLKSNKKSRKSDSPVSVLDLNAGPSTPKDPSIPNVRPIRKKLKSKLASFKKKPLVITENQRQRDEAWKHLTSQTQQYINNVLEQPQKVSNVELWSLDHNNSAKLLNYASTLGLQLADAPLQHLSRLLGHKLQQTPELLLQALTQNNIQYKPVLPGETPRVVMLNPQGGITQYLSADLGKHHDFGGQLEYVLQLSKALAKLGVQVDIITGKFKDDRFSAKYNESEEIIKIAGEGAQNVRILRIPFEVKDANQEAVPFVRKEELWQFLPKWAETIGIYYAKQGALPHASFGHYADGGLTATLLKQWVGIPFAYTPHSFGTNKVDTFLTDDNKSIDTLLAEQKSGNQFNKKATDLDPVFNFQFRVPADQATTQYANVIIGSSQSEWDDQHGHPFLVNSSKPKNSSNRFMLIKPGVNETYFSASIESEQQAVESQTITAMNAAITNQIPQNRRELPYVLVVGRLNKKKNLVGVLKAFAASPDLRAKANVMLLVKGGVRAFDDAQTFNDKFPDPEEREVADEIHELLKNPDMQGCVVTPGLNTQAQLGAVYRAMSPLKSQPNALSPNRQGIFTLMSLQEPFGLMVTEAGMVGLPILATSNGGPKDILSGTNARGEAVEYGMAVAPLDLEAIEGGLLKLLASPRQYAELIQQKVRDDYSYERTARGYREAFDKMMTS